MQEVATGLKPDAAPVGSNSPEVPPFTDLISAPASQGNSARIPLINATNSTWDNMKTVM